MCQALCEVLNKIEKNAKNVKDGGEIDTNQSTTQV